MTEDFREQLISLVRNEPWLLSLLRQARSLHLPDWYIAAGTIRNTVWNVLHGFQGNLHFRDVDLVYFDPLHLDREQERKFTTFLQTLNSSAQWDVVNQARIHLHSTYSKNITSSSESIAYWSETATCVGVRLELDDSLTLTCPHGLNDLFHLLVKPIPPPYQNLDLYRERIKQKQWQKTWPRLHILSDL